MSDLLPNIAKLADDICIIRSMQTEQINHDPAHTFMNTGTSISGKPSMGAWINYGLGSECDDLPGFVVLSSQSSRTPQPISSRQWHSGFLPSKFQGVPFHSTGDPVHYISNPAGVDRKSQGDVISAVNKLNRMRDAEVQNPEITTRIAQYELACRMQMSVPGLTDITDEPKAVMESYGVEGADGSFGYNCLLARRLAERGVRFIHLYHRGWDYHNNLFRDLKSSTESVDRPTHALITDLKECGMLDETLVIWGVSSAARRWLKETKRPVAGTTTSAGSRCSLPAAASSRASLTAPPTTWGIAPWTTWSTFTTSTPRCCTSWVSITSG